MRMRAELICAYGSERVSRAVGRALQPDNRRLAAGLVVRTKVTGKRVISTVGLDGRMETFLATLDDLLSCTLAAEILLC
jgi:hypothetical protein